MRMILIAAVAVLAGCVAQPVQISGNEARQAIVEGVSCSGKPAMCSCLRDRLSNLYRDDKEAVGLYNAVSRIQKEPEGPIYKATQADRLQIAQVLAQTGIEKPRATPLSSQERDLAALGQFRSRLRFSEDACALLTANS